MPLLPASMEAEEVERTVVGAVSTLCGARGGRSCTTAGCGYGGHAIGVDLADEETRVDPPPMFAWRPAVEDFVLGAAREEGAHVRGAIGIAYGWSHGGP